MKPYSKIAAALLVIVAGACGTEPAPERQAQEASCSNRVNANADAISEVQEGSFDACAGAPTHHDQIQERAIHPALVGVVSPWQPSPRIAYIQRSWCAPTYDEDYDRAPSGSLYLMNTDGTGKAEITTAGAATDPALQPNGSRIAYAAQTGGYGSFDIFTSNLDGTGRVRLTQGGENRHPAWSPDGRRIAFTRYGILNGAGSGIYVMNADGSAVQYLRAHAMHPAWSPDGSRILYTFNNPVYINIAVLYTYSVSGGSDRLIFSGIEPSSRAAWSPDGSMIALNVGGGGGGLYVINADGTGLDVLTDPPLTNPPVRDMNPSWSPDGRFVVFERNDPFVQYGFPCGTHSIFVRDRTWVCPTCHAQPLISASPYGVYNALPGWANTVKTPVIAAGTPP
jgi:Tol biopolymer transport system component